MIIILVFLAGLIIGIIGGIAGLFLYVKWEFDKENRRRL
jgi:hypothetical protein